MSEFRVLQGDDEMRVLKEAVIPVSDNKEKDMVLEELKNINTNISELLKKPHDKPVVNVPPPIVNVAVPDTVKLDASQVEKLSKRVVVEHGGGGGNTFIKNSRDVAINPATEEKQDAIVSAIENITIPAPTGGATEAKQDTIISAIEDIGVTTDLKVTLDGESVPVTGTLAVTQSGTWDEVGINDSGNSITVDNNGTFAVQVDPNAITATAVDASSSGDNTIVSITNTPRLYYISLSANGANSADVTAIVKIGASSKYKVSLKAGAIWARNVGAGRNYITGSASDDIIVNLSAAQTVHVSVEYADV